MSKEVVRQETNLTEFKDQCRSGSDQVLGNRLVVSACSNDSF